MSTPDYLEADAAEALLPDAGGVTVKHEGALYHKQLDGRWWREDARDRHFTDAEGKGVDPNEYLADRPRLSFVRHALVLSRRIRWTRRGPRLRPLYRTSRSPQGTYVVIPPEVRIDEAMVDRAALALIKADALEPYDRSDGRWRPAVLAEAVLRAALVSPHDPERAASESHSQ